MIIDSYGADVSSRPLPSYAGRVAPVVRCELGGDSARKDPDSDRRATYARAGLYDSRGRHADVPVSSSDVVA